MWRCNLYEPTEARFTKVPDDAGPAELLATMPPIRQVEVGESRCLPYGMQQPSDSHWVYRHGDYRFDVKWSDKDGWHDQHFIVSYDAVRGMYEPQRVAGVFTDWGRIEVYIEYFGNPSVYVWSSKERDAEPFKVAWSQY